MDGLVGRTVVSVSTNNAVPCLRFLLDISIALRSGYYATHKQLKEFIETPCFFFQAEAGIRDLTVTGVQTCALPISRSSWPASPPCWETRPLRRLPPAHRASRRERLGRHPRGWLGHPVLAAVHAAAPQAVPAPGGGPAAAGPGGGAPRGARARRPGARPHRSVPGGSGGRRRAADPAASDF